MGVKLKKWLEYNHDDEKTQTVFYNMSKTMKYIHEKDFCIKTFNLNEIEILNIEKLSPIQYNTVVKMPEEESSEIRHEDIYNLAFMQIGISTDMLDYLKPEFLKENFDSFVPLLPEEDVPYFKGIVTRGASVYYSDYIDEKNKREVARVQQESANSSKSNGLQKSKATAAGRALADKDTKKLYSPIEQKEGAYVSFLIFPIIMVLLGMILSIMLLFNS